MKSARKMILGAWLVLCLLLAQTVHAQAQPGSAVPSDCYFVLKFSDLDATSKKIGDFAATMGLTAMVPPLEKPLDAILDQMGVKDGINRHGELLFCGMEPSKYQMTFDQSGVILIPVSDYAAFLGNFKDAKTDGNLTIVQMKNDTTDTYVAHWGDYAALSPVKAIVAAKPTGSMHLPDAVAKEWASKDVLAVLNVEPVRAIALSGIDQGKSAMGDFLDQMAQSPTGGQDPMSMISGALQIAKTGPLLKIIGNQVLAIAHEYVAQADTVSIGLKIAPDGIGSTVMVSFKPDSYFGQTAGKIKNYQGSLFTGMPDLKYLFYAGIKQDPALTSEIVAHYIGSVDKQIADLGSDFSAATDWINAMKASIATTTSINMGMIAPSGTIGQDPIVQFVTIQHGDSKILQESAHKMFDAQMAFMSGVGIKNQMAVPTYSPAAKTVDGVSFDDIAVNMNLAAAGPARAQIQPIINMVYGPNGMHQYLGAVTDQIFITEMGLPDATLTAAIEAAKSNSDAVSKNAAAKAVADQLPKSRQAEVYIPLDVIANTGLAYAKAFNLDMGVKLPDDLPPVGVTLSSDGSAVRIDGYVPTQLIQAITSAGMQMYMVNQKQQNGGGGGGL